MAIETNSNNVRTTILDQATEGQELWSKDSASIALNRGGQWGLLPMIGGIDSDNNVHEWMYNQPYLRRDIIPIVLETPRIFELFDNGEYLPS